MGIFRDLVSNVANSRMQEEQQKLAYNLGLGKVLTNLIQNDYASPGDRALAGAYYQDLLSKHGGKEGKLLIPHINQLLSGYLAQTYMGKGPGGRPVAPTAPGGTEPQQGEPAVAPSAPAPEQPLPPGQTPGQPGGVNYGWPSMATLAPGKAQAEPAAQPAQPRGGLHPVLPGLAGVGKEMLGIPREQPRIAPDPSLFGPTPMQAAEQKERGVLAAGRLERKEFFDTIDKDVASGLMTKEGGDAAKADYDREMKPPGRPPGRGILSLQEQSFELHKLSLAQKLKKNVAELTTDEQLQALDDSRPMPENKIEDRDALNAHADRLAAQDPDRVAKLGRAMTGLDLKPQEKLDARMEWSKQKAMRGEKMPTDQELRDMVNYDLLTGKTTAMGMGAADPFRRAYQIMRAKIISERGAGEVAARGALFRSDQASLTSLTRITDAMSGWEKATRLNLEQVRKLSKQVNPRTGSTLANEYIQWAQGRLETYPLLSQFRVAVETGIGEYTKVMYSATPTGVTTDEQKKTGRSMLSTAMSEGNVDAAVDQMYIDMDNRFGSMNQQIEIIGDRIRSSTGAGGGGGGAGATTRPGITRGQIKGAVEGGFKSAPLITGQEQYDRLPAGTVYRTFDGTAYHTWTKQ